jgi:hypothetical protein
MLGSNLCITVLTGRRLPLLRRTLDSLGQADMSILRGSHVVAYVNGRDPGSVSYLESLGFINRIEYRDTDVPEPIGDAVSRLVTWIPRSSLYHMHLEDDWSCQSSTAQFLSDAAMILEHDSDVGQVRMRLKSERVMSKHLVTNANHSWSSRVAHGLKYEVSALHFTFNPSLVRIADVEKFFPSDHELTACKRYMKHYGLVAQLTPGVFRHIGDEGRSLRVQLGRA